MPLSLLACKAHLAKYPVLPVIQGPDLWANRRCGQKRRWENVRLGIPVRMVGHTSLTFLRKLNSTQTANLKK